MLKWLFGEKKNASEPAPAEHAARNPEVELPFEGEIATDTASLVIFDVAALKHRFDDTCDWWADPRDELVELRARNVLIVGLGSDGFYDVSASDKLDITAARFSLKAPSGRIFIGPGEEITGGGFEPDGKWGGYFIAVPPGDCEVSVTRSESMICLGIAEAQAFENDATQPFVV